ncbi:MAG: ABC transporter ATP-binding protein [Candidatus Marinimicrobia bacterium]|nr:ABC transporter ATP-binding protein [Candidatus Neomarinimicrobiota bacterium]
MAEVILSIKNLSKSFGKRKAVDNLSFDIREGEIFGFLGPNGAGKSTAIRSMLSLIKPDQGDIEIFTKSVRKFKNAALGGVGALVERPDFYEYLSAYQNLSFLATMDNVPKKRIDEVLEIVGLTDRGDDKVKAYSQGMKQRLGIAQALLSNPKLLILDEPTNGLDPRGMKEVRDLIRKLSQEGITILLSSHILHEVEQVCTTMAIINLGKLIKIGRVHDLLNESDTFITEIKAEPLEKARKALESIDYISNVAESDGLLKVRIANRDLKQLTRELVKADIDVSAIIPRTSLEDYFLSLTGDGI